MKNLILLFVLFISIQISFGQGYMEKIATETCGCVDQISDTLKGDLLEMELGLCMIKAATPYQKKLKKDHDLDFMKLDEEGEKLGYLLGIELAKVCPETILRFAGIADDEDDFEEAVAVEVNTVYGEISRSERKGFVFFSIKDVNGRIAKYVWLESIQSDLSIQTDHTLIEGKKVIATFEKRELFDPYLGEYRDFNVLLSLNKDE